MHVGFGSLVPRPTRVFQRLCGHALLNDSNNVERDMKVESGAELQLQLILEHPAQDDVKSAEDN